MRRSSCWAVWIAGIVFASVGACGCAFESKEGVRHLGVSRDAAWKATFEIVQSYFPVVQGDLAAGSIQSDYVGEASPLYRRRVRATVSDDGAGEAVIRLRVQREKLSSSLGDYGAAFQKGTWVEVADDEAQGALLLREIGSRFGVK